MRGAGQRGDKAGRRHEKGRPAWEWASQRGSGAGWKSEKFAGKLRISLEKWPKVINSLDKLPKVINSE